MIGAVAVGAVLWLAASGYMILIAIVLCAVVPWGLAWAITEARWLHAVPEDQRDALKHAHDKKGGKR